MKRGAENQLRKGDEESEEFESSSESPGQGFQKAPESVLSTRKIKPLPSRNAASKPMFGEVSIANPGNSNSFSSATTSIFLPPTPSPSKISFNSDADAVSAKPTTTPFTFTPSQAATTSSLEASSEHTRGTTSTSKAFASILASTTNIFGNPTSNSQTSPFTTTVPSAPEKSTSESELTKYYTNIRGLNVSLLNSIRTSIENDPFFDFAGVLESYKVHRSKLQKEFDELSKTSKADKISSTLPNSSIFVPPSVFKPSVASEPPKSNTIPASSGPTFGFSDPAPNIFSSSTKFSSTPSAAFAPIASTTADKSSIFGAKSGQTTEHSSLSDLSAPAEKPFSFGTPVTNPFGPATNLFGSSSSTSLSHKLDSDRTFPFGRSSIDSTTDKKSTPTISFGTPSSASKNSGIFFGFGSAPVSSNVSTTPGASVFSQKETMNEDGTEETGTSGQGEPKETVPGLLTPNPHDEEGTGEENEETVHAVKLKAYRMKKADEEGGSGWAELGMGVFRLKKDKSTGARRVLLRNSTNGKININFKIYSGLKPSISKKALTFVGHFEGISQTYCVRLPSESQANELKGALDKEVEFVKAKATST